MMVKSYIDLEIAKEGRKTYKELKKEGNRPKQRPIKSRHNDHKCRPLLSHSSKEVYEKFTPLNQKISVVLVELERKDWATPPTPRKNGALMGSKKG